MLFAKAVWESGVVREQWFWSESERIVWIVELKEACKKGRIPLPTIEKGDDRQAPRKKIFCQMGLEADITDHEFDILQGGGTKAQILLHNLLSDKRLRFVKEAFFPTTADDGYHEIGNPFLITPEF